MREIVIASAVRTPVGKFLGSFSNVSAVELGTIAVKEALKRANIKPEQVDETYNLFWMCYTISTSSKCSKTDFR